MKVFMSFGFNERDKWIKDIVIPILKGFGFEVDLGEHIEGQVIRNTVEEKIKSSDAILAFFTRREESGNLTNDTHPWVIDEVNFAFDISLEYILVVREKGVKLPSGKYENKYQERQFINYDEDELDKFLIDLVKVARNWSDNSDNSLKIMFLPPEFYNEVTAIEEEKIKCNYCFMLGSRETDWYLGELKDFGAAMGIYVNCSGLPRSRDNINIQVKVSNQTTELWRSAWEPLEQRKVTMKKKVSR